MLGKYAAAYVVIVETIDALISNLDDLAMQNNNSASDTNTDRLYLALIGKEPKLADHLGKNIDDILKGLLTHVSSRMTFPSVAAQVRRISESISRGDGPKALGSQMQELKTRLKDELNEREFLYIPPERVRFYKEPMLFGKEAHDRFPLAIDDIEEAGKCLSLGQGTACVLHTMRVMEVGLKALGRALGIPYAPSWESYLSQISSNIAKKHKVKTLKWKRDEKFYRDLSGDLLTIKQAWRNPTMHVDRKYSAEEAEQIFVAAKNFMLRLAEHFTQREVEKFLK
jgi:HEPN domain-containing protein